VELAEQVPSPLELVRDLSSIDHVEALDGYCREMTESIGRLLDDGVDALQVTQAVAAVNDVLTSRLLDLAERRLGRPPCAYAWLALGSHGRGEQVLSSDQDSALAYAGPPTAGSDGEQDSDAQEYFGRLATTVVDSLARAGIPRCTGGYMATGWSHPLGTYVDHFHRWVDHPMPAALLKAEVFLDVRPVHGSLDVGRLDEILVRGGQRGVFVVQMARAAVTFTPPRGWFGSMRTEDGFLDVKRAGTAAIVLLARLYALAAGSRARTTLLRLEAAGRAGRLSSSAVEQLTDAYRLLTELRLRHQVEQVRCGVVADNRVRVDTMAPADLQRLRSAMRTVRVVQQITATRYATHTVT
jgi:CBS domain-containing protein